MTSITIKTDEYKTRYMYVTCEQVKNISANTSTINWTITVTGGLNNYYDTGATTLTIGGQQAYYMRRVVWNEYIFPAAKGSVSGSVTIPHDENGKAEIEVSLSTAIYFGDIKTYKQTWALDNIPRAAKLTGASSILYDNDFMHQINYDNPAGDAVDSLQMCISMNNFDDNVMAYRDIPKDQSYYTFTLTEQEKQNLYRINQEYQQGTTGVIYFGLRTIFGEQEYYSSLTRQYVITEPEPKVEVEIKDVKAEAVALTGNPATMIKGFNSMVVNITDEPQKGATITSRKTTNGGAVSWYDNSLFENTEHNTFTVRVTDTRAAYFEDTFTVPMVEYYKPTCNLKTSVAMVGETTARITVEVSGNFFSGNFGARDNELTICYKYKRNNENYGTEVLISAPTINNGKYSARDTFDVNYTDTYTVQAIAYDLPHTEGITSAESVVKVTPVFEWSGTDFKFNVPVSILDNTIVDWVVEHGTSNGWSYRKWFSGRAECWKILTLNTDANTQWGGLWRGSLTSRQTYPFNFTGKPVEQVTLQSGSYGAFVLPADGGDGVNGSAATARYTICRPAATTSGEYYLSFYIVGNWR